MFEYSRILKLGTNFILFLFICLFILHFVNFLRLLQLANVMSNLSDCVFRFHKVNRTTGLLLTDQDT